MDNNSDISIKDGEGNAGAENSVGSEKVVQSPNRIFDEVKEIFERTRMLLQEIDQNYEAHETGGLNRNIALICQLSNNMAHVGNLYSNISSYLSRSIAKGSSAAIDGIKGDCKAAVMSAVEETD